MKLPILWLHFNASIQFGIGKHTKENWIKLGAQTIFKSPFVNRDHRSFSCPARRKVTSFFSRSMHSPIPNASFDLF